MGVVMSYMFLKKLDNMSLKEAIELLSYHQRWRKGMEEEMTPPAKITEAIDTILNFFKNHRI